MAKDQDILDQVNKLVAEEKVGPRPKGRGLRTKLQHREIGDPGEVEGYLG